MNLDLPKDKNVILFDGVCNLCNSAVQYIIKRDTKGHFRFTALQSTTGKAIVTHYAIDTSKVDSILVYTPEKGVVSKSTAALKIASKLSFPTRLLAVFFIIPKPIRDWVYDGIAKNRYKWFGKQDACMIPTPELKRLFLD